MTVPDRLKEARIAAKFKTASAAARAHGWNRHTYTAHENGHRELSRDVAIIYARAFRVSLEWLLTGKLPKRPGANSGLREIPILRLEPGRAITKSELRAFLSTASVVGYATIPEAEYSADLFVMLVLDDGANGPPLWVRQGDSVEVDSSLSPQPGSVVAVSVGKEVVVRRLSVLSRDANGIPIGIVKVKPFNPDYPPEETVPVDQILGVVTNTRRRVPNPITI